MKITRKAPPFVPVSLVLETQKEVDDLFATLEDWADRTSANNPLPMRPFTIKLLAVLEGYASDDAKG